MSSTSKLKPINTNGYLYGLLGGVVLCIVFALIWSRFGENTVDKVVGILMFVGALLNLIVWIRTRNRGFLIYFLWPALMSIRNLCGWTETWLVTTYAITVIVLVLLFIYMIYTKDVVWKYRKILELAAKPIDGTTDGFTSRPYPAGTASYTKEDITAFGKFLTKNLIAFPYMEDNGLVLILSRNEMMDFLFLRKDYDRDTYVYFDFTGKMTVHIAKKEYDIYKEEFTFDQLCQSLGDLFKTFLIYFQNGEKKKIIEIVNSQS